MPIDLDAVRALAAVRTKRLAWTTPVLGAALAFVNAAIDGDGNTAPGDAALTAAAVVALVVGLWLWRRPLFAHRRLPLRLGLPADQRRELDTAIRTATPPSAADLAAITVHEAARYVRVRTMGLYWAAFAVLLLLQPLFPGTPTAQTVFDVVLAGCWLVIAAAIRRRAGRGRAYLRAVEAPTSAAGIEALLAR
ncbi:MAG: hypothetical protein ACTHMS_17010 [Jatrophihabitans sp.]|uniref:hypothetical protein n=1 Tax=Jatrophihabitans sp. TaxID=1932789 RepID=UPI003F7D8C20